MSSWLKREENPLCSPLGEYIILLLELPFFYLICLAERNKCTRVNILFGRRQRNENNSMENTPLENHFLNATLLPDSLSRATTPKICSMQWILAVKSNKNDTKMKQNSPLTLPQVLRKLVVKSPG